MELSEWEKLAEVWACYDAKLGRCTRLKVLEVNAEFIKVVGVLWADDTKTESTYIFPRDDIEGMQGYAYGGEQTYSDGEPTLMALMGIGEGDYYRIIPLDPSTFR